MSLSRSDHPPRLAACPPRLPPWPPAWGGLSHALSAPSRAQTALLRTLSGWDVGATYTPERADLGAGLWLDAPPRALRRPRAGHPGRTEEPAATVRMAPLIRGPGAGWPRVRPPGGRVLREGRTHSLRGEGVGDRHPHHRGVGVFTCQGLGPSLAGPRRPLAALGEPRPHGHRPPGLAAHRDGGARAPPSASAGIYKLPGGLTPVLLHHLFF